MTHTVLVSENKLGNPSGVVLNYYVGLIYVCWIDGNHNMRMIAGMCCQ